jgi:hypothetical protein
VVGDEQQRRAGVRQQDAGAASRAACGAFSTSPAIMASAGPVTLWAARTGVPVRMWLSTLSSRKKGSGIKPR